MLQMCDGSVPTVVFSSGVSAAPPAVSSAARLGPCGALGPAMGLRGDWPQLPPGPGLGPAAGLSLRPYLSGGPL